MKKIYLVFATFVALISASVFTSSPKNQEVLNSNESMMSVRKQANSIMTIDGKAVGKIRLYYEKLGLAIEIDGVKYGDAYDRDMGYGYGGLNAYIQEIGNADNIKIKGSSLGNNITIYYEKGELAIEIDGVKYGDEYARDNQISGGGLYAYIQNVGDGTEVVLTAKSDLRPAINGNEHFASNIDSPVLVSEFIKEIKAIDDIDGDISHKIVIESDNYSGKTVIGTYDVNISVTDSSNNKSTFQFWVTLADITAPSANADLSISKINYNQTFDLELFQTTIVVSDNYYNKSDITIVKTKDNYTSNKNKLGTYDVEFTITDKSNNFSKITKKIQVYDGVKPVINGTKVYEKSYMQIITTTDVLEALTASDEIDGDISSKFIIESDNYSGNANKPSKDPYKIVVSVTDAAGNKQTAEVTIKVIDDKTAEWYITNGVTINLSKDTVMTRQQIIDLLASAGRVQVSPYSLITYRADTYSNNLGNPGIYQLAFVVKEPNGNQADYQFAVNVMGDAGTDTDKVEHDPTIVDFIVENKVIIITAAVILIAFVLVTKKKKKTK